MKVVPHAFYQHPAIEKIMIEGECCIISKQVDQVSSNNERYLSAHALTLVLAGDLQVVQEDGRLTQVQQNELIFLPKGLYMVTDILPKNQPFKAMVFFFDEVLTDAFLNHFSGTRKHQEHSLLKIAYNDQLQYFVNGVLHLYRNTSNSQFTRPKLLELLHLIALTPEGTAFVNQLQSLKQRTRRSIQDFMMDNFDKPLNVEDYAYLTGRSISTFRRDFKSRFHISPKKWLIEKRLQKAAQLLARKNEPVAQIANAVGYENVSHFIKAFHQNFGISPKQYHISHRKKAEIISF